MMVSVLRVCLTRLRAQQQRQQQWRRNLVLGIETSCDDTGAALIDLQGKVLSECLSSQYSTRFGGVIPTFAMYFHADKIEHVVTRALNKAGVRIEDVSAIAVTNRPGLKGPLIVGTDYAKYLCMKYNKPMIPVHHMAAHALTVRLETAVKFPYMILLISGGHCLLGIAQDVDKFLILGSTVDDSPGEALDKIARRLRVHNLADMRDLSGGRAIEILAQKAESRVEFPVPMRQYRDCNFSFSGLKAQVKWHIEQQEKALNTTESLPATQMREICGGVQYTVAKHLCERIQRGIDYSERWELMAAGSTLVISGGVASNNYLRSCISRTCANLGWQTVFPPIRLCTDNGLMIAWTGLELWRRGLGIIQPDAVLSVPVETRCPLGENISEAVSRANIRCKWVSMEDDAT